MLDSLQRSEDWFKIRLGRFTASSIYRILGKDGLKATQKSIDTYSFEKAVEKVYGKSEEEIYSKDIERGVNLEPFAFKCFKEIMLYNFIDVEECSFYPIGKNAGATPDGKPSDNSVLEIKCPRRNKFFKIVANGIAEADPKYIDQMQMQMKATNSEKAYFFNYYVEKGIEYWHKIEVPRCESKIKLIEDRILIATEIRDNYIEKLNINAQWI